MKIKQIDPVEAKTSYNRKIPMVRRAKANSYNYENIVVASDADADRR